MVDQILEQFDLPVIYIDTYTFKSKRITGKDTCNDLKNMPDYKKLKIETAPSMLSMKNICTVSIPEEPELPIFTISSSTEYGNKIDGVLKKADRIYTITEPDGTKNKITILNPLLYKKFPLPFFKCTLVSNNTSWGCGYGFQRQDKNFHGIVPDLDINAIGKALGLKRIDASERYKANTKNEYLEKKIENRLKNLKNEK